MPSIDDLQFDTTGWTATEEPIESRRAWVNEWGDVLTLRYNAGVPKTPSLFRAQSLHDYFARKVAAGGGCILSLDLLHVKGVAISKLIFKSPQSEDRWGYMASLLLAYKDFSYSLRVQALDGPEDAARGEYVWNWLHESHPADADCLALWFGRDGVAHDTTEVHPCLADDIRWDAEFPQHPLSRLRAEVGRIVPSLVVSRDVKNSQPHRG